MYVLYWALWVIFNGNLTLEIGLFGIVIAALVFAFTCKFMDYSFEKEKRLWKSLGKILVFCTTLVIEILKANWAVLRMILTEKEEPQPILVKFRTDLKTPLGRAALANAITLTPGTITVLMEENEYAVHCLDEDYADGIDSSEIVNLLTDLEAM